MLSPAQLVTWVNVTAVQMAQGKSADELALLGGVFTQLGDTLTTMSIRKSAVEAVCKGAANANATSA